MIVVFVSRFEPRPFLSLRSFCFSLLFLTSRPTFPSPFLLFNLIYRTLLPVSVFLPSPRLSLSPPSPPTDRRNVRQHPQPRTSPPPRTSSQTTHPSPHPSNDSLLLNRLPPSPHSRSTRRIHRSTLRRLLASVRENLHEQPG